MPVPFSRGVPRPGQWVLVDGTILGIAVEPNRVGPLGKSAFGVLGEDVITRVPPAHDVIFKASLPDLTSWRVDVVDKTGVNTVGSLLVALGRLEPLTDLQRIPPERRATCALGWSPLP